LITCSVKPVAASTGDVGRLNGHRTVPAAPLVRRLDDLFFVRAEVNSFLPVRRPAYPLKRFIMPGRSSIRPSASTLKARQLPLSGLLASRGVVLLIVPRQNGALSVTSGLR
jgi:hypothetical protein